MKKHLTVRNATLLAALATVAATAWATSDTLAEALTPLNSYAEELAKPAPQAVAATEAVTETETVVSTPADAMPATAPQPAAPAVEQRVAAEAPIRVEQKAMSLDERIQTQVIDRIAAMPNVSGKVGVESSDAVVTLTGLVTTAGQAYRVQKVAYSVDGVRRVDNQIRAKIGGSV